MQNNVEKRRSILNCIYRSIMLTMFIPWNLEENVSQFWKPFMRYFELFLEFLNYFLCLHLVLILLNVHFNFTMEDLEFICHCLAQFTVFTWAIWAKVYFRRINIHLLLDLTDFYQKNYWTRSAPGFTYVTIGDAFKKANAMIWIYTLSSSSVLMVFLLPMVSGKRNLPLPCWYPFDYKEPYVYELVYMIQFLAQIQVVFSFCASSGYFFVLSLITVGQYDILNCSLKNILATAYIMMDASIEELRELRKQQELCNEELNVYRISMEHHIDSLESLKHLKPAHMPKPKNLSAAVRVALKDCVFHHMFLLKLLTKLEKFFHIPWLIKSGQFIFLICLVGFVYAKSNDTSNKGKVAMMFIYMLLAMGELFLICHFSEMISHSSQSCGEAIMRCPWHLHISELRKDLIFFLIHSTRYFRLTAGKIYFLNYERFRTIVTTSFSFITILQNMDKRQSKLLNQ